jgi:hypothetical protein
VISDGNLNAAIPGTDRADEVGDMAKTLQVFRDNMAEAERLRTEQQAEQQRQLKRGRRLEAAALHFEKSINDIASQTNLLARSIPSYSMSVALKRRASYAVIRIEDHSFGGAPARFLDPSCLIERRSTRNDPAMRYGTDRVLIDGGRVDRNEYLA